jgi:hypothetical protein
MQYNETFDEDVVYGPGRRNVQFDLRTLIGLEQSQMIKKLQEWAARNQATALDFDELGYKISKLSATAQYARMLDAFRIAFPNVPVRYITPDPEEKPMQSKYTDESNNHVVSTLASCLHSLHTRVSALEGAM